MKAQPINSPCNMLTISMKTFKTSIIIDQKENSSLSTFNLLTFVSWRWCPIRNKDSPSRCRWAAALTGHWSEQLGLLDVDLSVSQAEPGGLHIEFAGLQVSFMGLDTAELPTELIFKAVTVPGTGVNRQGLWVTEVAGGAINLVTGQSAMLCWLSRYTQYSNVELWLFWEKQKGRKFTQSRGECRNKVSVTYSIITWSMLTSAGQHECNNLSWIFWKTEFTYQHELV